MYHADVSDVTSEFYWPSMALDVVRTVRSCSNCAKERLKLRRHSKWLKLFSATRPLEFVSIDILGPFRKTKNGHENLLVITDRYSKLKRAVPLRSTTAHAVPAAFCDHWVFAHGPPVSFFPTMAKNLRPNISSGLSDLGNPKLVHGGVPPTDQRSSGAVQPHYTRGLAEPM